MFLKYCLICLNIAWLSGLMTTFISNIIMQITEFFFNYCASGNIIIYAVIIIHSVLFWDSLYLLAYWINFLAVKWMLAEIKSVVLWTWPWKIYELCLGMLTTSLSRYRHWKLNIHSWCVEIFYHEMNDDKMW